MKLKLGIQNLHFVPETGTARPRGTLRELIRSNARRKPRRRPRQSSRAKLKPRNEENDSKDADEVRLTGRSPVIQCQLEATKARLHRGPECNAMDPFYTLPISEVGQTQFLTYHCEFLLNLYFEPAASKSSGMM
jgi:hypothetical protein